MKYELTKEVMIKEISKFVDIKNKTSKYYDKRMCTHLLRQIERYLYCNESGISSEAFGDRKRGILYIPELIEFSNYLKQDIPNVIEVEF